LLVPVIEPELSTRMMTSFGLDEASIYHSLIRQSNVSTWESFQNTPENAEQITRLFCGLSLKLQCFHDILLRHMITLLGDTEL
jgi:hypothetical protein